MRTLLFFVFSFFFISQAMATQQALEYIMYKGEKRTLQNTPLESYFTKDKPRPKNLFSITSTALWRGYIGTWEINDGWLNLKELQTFSGDGEVIIPAHKVFQGRDYPVKAEWYTGMLRIPGSDDAGMHSVFSNGHYVVVTNGEVVSELIVDKKGPLSTKSPEDLARVLLAEEDVEEDWQWYDARLLESKAFDDIKIAGTPFKTRAIFDPAPYVKGASLYVNMTPTTNYIRLKVKEMPEVDKKLHYRPVEVDAYYVESKKGYDLYIDTIRPLSPGETVHHKDFKVIKEE